MLAQLQAMLVELRAEDVAGPAGMGEQVPHRDLGRHLFVRIAGRYLPMGSSRASLCASTSCRVATAVNILFIEPIRNLVAGVFATPALRSARPRRR